MLSCEQLNAVSLVVQAIRIDVSVPVCLYEQDKGSREVIEVFQLTEEAELRQQLHLTVASTTVIW